VRRQDDDLLRQRAAVDGLRPGDPGERLGQVVVGQRILRHRGQRGLRVELVGQLGLLCEQVGGRHEREQLRRLPPASGRHELLDLACDGAHCACLPRRAFALRHGHHRRRLDHVRFRVIPGTLTQVRRVRHTGRPHSRGAPWTTPVTTSGVCAVATRPPVGLPKLSKRARVLLTIAAVLVLLLLLGARFLNAYVDWLWFGEVGARGVFTTVLLTRAILFVATGLLVGGALAISLMIAYRTRPVFVPVSGEDDPLARYRSIVVGRVKLFGIGIPVLAGLVAGVSGQGNWETVQMFLNGSEFGRTDPQFGNDIGFYVFDLPFLGWVLGWVFVAVVVAFIGGLMAHYLFGGIRLAGRGGSISGPARVQLSILVGLFVLLKAVEYFLDRYNLLLSDRNSLFTGATYTDLNAVLPAKLILLCICVFCAIAFFVGAFLRNIQLPAIALVLLILSGLIIGVAWPAILEQF